MPIPSKYLSPFESGAYYHIVCKALDNQKLFFSDENKRYFLKRYSHYLKDYLNTYCYNLLNNHCHFLVKAKEEDEIRTVLKLLNSDQLTTVQQKFISADITLDTLIERQFNSFFVSYTRSFNILNKKKGHLFDSPFKRILVENENHLSQLVIYINANAVKHKLVENIADFLTNFFIV